VGNIYKITEASKYLGISINSLKTLANNGKLNSFKTGGEHRRFREDDLDAYMGVKKEKQERLTGRGVGSQSFGETGLRVRRVRSIRMVAQSTTQTLTQLSQTTRD